MTDSNVFTVRIRPGAPGKRWYAVEVGKEFAVTHVEWTNWFVVAEDALNDRYISRLINPADCEVVSRTHPEVESATVGVRDEQMSAAHEYLEMVDEPGIQVAEGEHAICSIAAALRISPEQFHAEWEKSFVNYAGRHAFEAHPLLTIFYDATAQVAAGKGNERHGNGAEFMEQPWVDLAATHGRGFLTGQAAKKLREAQRFDDHDRWEREMLGAINYAAMAVLHARKEKQA